jgi:hypothetical protein
MVSMPSGAEELSNASLGGDDTGLLTYTTGVHDNTFSTRPLNSCLVEVPFFSELYTPIFMKLVKKSFKPNFNQF